MKALFFGFALLASLFVFEGAQAWGGTNYSDGYHRGYYRVGAHSGHQHDSGCSHRATTSYYRQPSYYHTSNYRTSNYYYPTYYRTNTTRYSYSCPAGYKYSASTRSCRRDTYGYGYSYNRRYETQPIVLLD